MKKWLFNIKATILGCQNWNLWEVLMIMVDEMWFKSNTDSNKTIKKSLIRADLKE